PLPSSIREVRAGPARLLPPPPGTPPQSRRHASDPRSARFRRGHWDGDPRGCEPPRQELRPAAEERRRRNARSSAPLSGPDKAQIRSPSVREGVSRPAPGELVDVESHVALLRAVLD